MHKPDSFGTIGERIAFEWLKTQGYAVLPAAWIENGGAPLLESQVEKLIAPDFQIFKNGCGLWVDVKTKGRMAFYNRWQRWQTGCAQRHFDAYKMVARKTSIPGALLFIHLREKTIDFGLLDWIESDAQREPYKPGNHFTEDMIFFGIDRFDRYELAAGQLKKLQAASVPPRVIRPWETNRKPPTERQGLLF